MKSLILVSSLLYLSFNLCLAQDTFSIVAVDTATGEVGSAGASCVDLFQTGFSNDHFLGELFPGVGAINTQAYYLPANQDSAANQMNLGKTPSEIIQWLVANDVQGQPEIRQYGVTAIINGLPEAAAHTGTSTDNYKNHIVGPNYSIQGNILLGQQVLDSMESRFLQEDGDLACKLMAALQGANMVGADSRCSSNGTSSLFAFVKVAQPTDVFGSPSFIASVRTADNAGIEPIDSLQIKFNQVHACGNVSISESSVLDDFFTISPNPTSDYLMLEPKFDDLNNWHYTLYNLNGELIRENKLTQENKVDMSKLQNGVYFINIVSKDRTFNKKIIKY
jgi:uncharacterized Ntn-hydrolase superfamily protein